MKRCIEHLQRLIGNYILLHSIQFPQPSLSAQPLGQDKDELAQQPPHLEGQAE